MARAKKSEGSPGHQCQRHPRRTLIKPIKAKFSLPHLTQTPTEKSRSRCLYTQKQRNRNDQGWCVSNNGHGKLRWKSCSISTRIGQRLLCIFHSRVCMQCGRGNNESLPSFPPSICVAVMKERKTCPEVQKVTPSLCQLTSRVINYDGALVLFSVFFF